MEIMKTTSFYLLFIISLLMVACQSTTSGDSSQTDSVKTIPETYGDIDSILTNENSKKSLPDTFGILQFYKNHNMGSLSLHFDTTEVTEFVQSSKEAIDNGFFDKKGCVIYDGEGNLNAYFDPDSSLVLLRVDQALGDAIGYDEYWFKNDTLVFYSSYSEGDSMDEYGDYVENDEPNTVEECFFLKEKLVYWIYKAQKTETVSFNLEDFRKQNEYILSNITYLKKELQKQGD